MVPVVAGRLKVNDASSVSLAFDIVRRSGYGNASAPPSRLEPPSRRWLSFGIVPLST